MSQSVWNEQVILNTLFPANLLASTEEAKTNTTKATIRQEHRDNIKQNKHKKEKHVWLPFMTSTHPAWKWLWPHSYSSRGPYGAKVGVRNTTDVECHAVNKPRAGGMEAVRVCPHIEQQTRTWNNNRPFQLVGILPYLWICSEWEVNTGILLMIQVDDKSHSLPVPPSPSICMIPPFYGRYPSWYQIPGTVLFHHVVQTH